MVSVKKILTSPIFVPLTGERKRQHIKHWVIYIIAALLGLVIFTVVVGEVIPKDNWSVKPLIVIGLVDLVFVFVYSQFLIIKRWMYEFQERRARRGR